jgi:hypothetical protein
VRAGTPAARAERPNKNCVQQLVNELQVKNQKPRSPTTTTLICAADSRLGELNRVLEAHAQNAPVFSSAEPRLYFAERK